MLCDIELDTAHIGSIFSDNLWHCIAHTKGMGRAGPFVQVSIRFDVSRKYFFFPIKLIMFVYCSDRLGHVINNDTSEQSPLFLLFLDCTWQLLQQFPEEFEFSETFLTTLWDSAFLPIFDTFLFNSEHDRQVAIRKV